MRSKMSSEMLPTPSWETLEASPVRTRHLSPRKLHALHGRRNRPGIFTADVHKRRKSSESKMPSPTNRERVRQTVLAVGISHDHEGRRRPQYGPCLGSHHVQPTKRVFHTKRIPCLHGNPRGRPQIWMRNRHHRVSGIVLRIRQNGTTCVR